MSAKLRAGQAGSILLFAECIGVSRLSSSLRAACLRFAAFSLVMSGAFSLPVSAQKATTPRENGGTIIPAPPIFYSPNWFRLHPLDPHPENPIPHQAQQDANDPTHAHDSTTGQNLYWDSDRKTWVDSQTGQGVGFDGARTADGSIIPAPPIFYSPNWFRLHPLDPHPENPIPHQAQQDLNDPTRAFDSTTGQNLYWDPDKRTWVDSATGQGVGFDGVIVPTTPAPTPPTTTTPKPPSQPSSSNPVSMSGFTPSIQLRGFGGATFINGNTPATAGFDGAVLFPLGNRVLVGPTAGFQWVDSSIIKTIGGGPPPSTFINTSVGFKSGNFGGRIGFPFGGWEIGITGGATVAGSTITQATGFCGGTGGSLPPGCTVLSTTTTHDTVVGRFVGGYISHSIFSHVGVFVEYDYHRLKDTKSSVSVFDLHYSDVVAGLVLSFGRHQAK